MSDTQPLQPAGTGTTASSAAAGAAVLVIVGPLANQYVRRLILSQAGRN